MAVFSLSTMSKAFYPAQMFIRSFHTSKPLFLFGGVIKEGATLPNHTLFEHDAKTKINTKDLFKGKKSILFGVPGAFTPGCSKTHLPGYINQANDFRQLGYDQLVCVTVNDPYVSSAWAKEHRAEGKVKVLADPKGEFTKALGLTKDMTEQLGNVRSSRYAMVINDNKVEKVLPEPDGAGLTCSLAENVIGEIKKGNFHK